MFRDSDDNNNNINIFEVGIKDVSSDNSKEDDSEDSIICDKEKANIETDVYFASFKTSVYQVKEKSAKVSLLTYRNISLLTIYKT